MRIGISFKVLPGVRVGISRSAGRRSRTRVWASERILPGVRVSESATLGRRKRRR